MSPQTSGRDEEGYAVHEESHAIKNIKCHVTLTLVQVHEVTLKTISTCRGNYTMCCTLGWSFDLKLVNFCL